MQGTYFLYWLVTEPASNHEEIAIHIHVLYIFIMYNTNTEPQQNTVKGCCHIKHIHKTFQQLIKSKTPFVKVREAIQENSTLWGRQFGKFLVFWLSCQSSSISTLCQWPEQVWRSAVMPSGHFQNEVCSPIIHSLPSSEEMVSNCVHGQDMTHCLPLSSPWGTFAPTKAKNGAPTLPLTTKRHDYYHQWQGTITPNYTNDSQVYGYLWRAVP